jgi:hypothetical protein
MIPWTRCPNGSWTAYGYRISKVADKHWVVCVNDQAILRTETLRDAKEAVSDQLNPPRPATEKVRR